jgi:hypothetical protein
MDATPTILKGPYYSNKGAMKTPSTSRYIRVEGPYLIYGVVNHSIWIYVINYQLSTINYIVAIGIVIFRAHHPIYR